MVTHHPDSRLLNEFSAGSLPLAQSICISLHLKYCPQCQRDHGRLQQLGAAMFEHLAPRADNDEQLLEQVLSRLDEEPPLGYERSSGGGDAYPPLVQRLMERDFDDLPWKRMGPELRVSKLRTGDRENEFALYHIKAGGSIPRHSHRGTELTQVLQGSFSDENGVYLEGDFIMRDASAEHTPTASKSADCICVGVLDAPIRFTGWPMRPLNPFLKLEAR